MKTRLSLNKWKKEEVELIKNNYQKMTYPEMARALKRSESSVVKKVYRLGFRKPNFKWTKEQNDFLISNVNIKSEEEIADILNKSKESVNHHLNFLGLKKGDNDRNLQLDENTAYLYGVYRGDGCIWESKKSNKMHFTLEAKDEDFVNYFEKIIKKVSHRGTCRNFRVRKHYVGKYLTNTLMYSARTNDILLCRFLKNLTLKNIENSNDEVKKSFLKGMYDSEGSISASTNAGSSINLCNTELDLIDSCIKFLLRLGFYPGGMYKNYSGLSNKIVYNFSLNNLTEIRKFSNLVGFTIERKRLVLENVLLRLALSYLFNKITKERELMFQAKTLREGGNTFREIGQIMGINAPHAFKLNNLAGEVKLLEA